MSNTDMSDSDCGINVSRANAEIPRRVYFDSLSIKVLSVALLTLVAGIIMLIWITYGTVTNLDIHKELGRDGLTAIANITRTSENRGGHFVRYAFSVDGVPYSGQAEMESDDYNLPGDRNALLIRYLPNDPTVNQPDKWQWVSIWDLFPFLLLLALTALGASLVLRAWRLRALMRNGIVALARVTASVPKNKLFTIYYEFTGKDNMTIEGSSVFVEEYEAGALIPIVYRQSNPERNSRFPVAGLRVAE